ncbi:hypothetical protein [Enterococcus sp. 5H]|uniref:hypothetical protein n=1 Tax=Enterococcus sp. 5H TaxID=1229490 RepID=UPI0023027C48|nr:hypothetical protein [Enterococcus sp. 5H]
MSFDETWEECCIWLVGFTTTDGMVIHKIIVLDNNYDKVDVKSIVKKNFIGIDKIDYIDLFEDLVFCLKE